MNIREFLRHRPYWLYESLPYAYCASGLALLIWGGKAAVDPLLMKLSAIALLLAGVQVLFLRWRYRRRRVSPRDDQEVALVMITWDRSKEIDNEEFNTLNRQLFIACQHLIADAPKAVPEDLQESVEQTIELIRYSFEFSEELLRGLNPGKADALHATHQGVLRELDQRYREFVAGNVRRNAFIAFLVYRVVVYRVTVDGRMINEAIWD